MNIHDEIHLIGNKISLRLKSMPKKIIINDLRFLTSFYPFKAANLPIEYGSLIELTLKNCKLMEFPCVFKNLKCVSN